MNQEVCRVIAVENKHIWLEALPKTGCAKCDAGEGCGGGIIARLFSRKPIRFRVFNTVEAVENDTIAIEVPDDLIVKASILAYILPLLCFMLAALLFQVLFNSELLTVLAGFASLFMSIFFGRQFSVKIKDFDAISLKRLPTEGRWGGGIDTL